MTRILTYREAMTGGTGPLPPPEDVTWRYEVERDGWCAVFDSKLTLMEAIRGWLRAGDWPEGQVIVKEIRNDGWVQERVIPDMQGFNTFCKA